MFEILKKAILFGMGVASMTGEKMQKLVDELVRKGEISEKEGMELFDELMSRSKKARQDFQDQVDSAVAKALERLNIARKDEIERIWARIEQLERTKADRVAAEEPPPEEHIERPL